MAKEKWLINPAELDKFQREIRQLNLDEDYVIKGCAGSGKTILALYRAHDIRIQTEAEGNPAIFTILVYTTTLRSFIRSGILELGLKLNQVIHFKQWDGSNVDYIIVDECQDFDKNQIQEFIDAKFKSLMLYGDSNQRLYPNSLTTEEISSEFGIPFKELDTNYRLPRPIADFASYLTNDDGIVARCVKTTSRKPRVKKLKHWQDELSFIISEIKTRNYTDVAILLPFNTKRKASKTNEGIRNVETVKEYFEFSGVRCEAKIEENCDLDFDSELPKIMTYHSAKGLQFETVFIPFADHTTSWMLSTFKSALYVALTRTYRNLYITHSEDLTQFFDDIPTSKYD